MEPAEMKKYLVPGLAVAAVIAVGGLLVGLGGPPPETATTAPGDPTAPIGAALVKPGTDITNAGMVTTSPAADAPEWRPLTQGIQVWDVKEGDGDTLPVGHKGQVAIHYTGWLARGGMKFDGTQGKPYAEFSLGGLIAGWQNGMPGMRIGGIRRLLIPAAQGYGSISQGSIPANADLIFEIKLIGFKAGS
jgi:FKBP-type peptidyl-prolyl cis-trans isomerase FkpA